MGIGFRDSSSKVDGVFSRVGKERPVAVDEM